MKYIIKYYRKEKGVWKYDVKLTTDFDLLIKYLKKIESCKQYKLYAVTTDWEGTKNDQLARRDGTPCNERRASVCGEKLSDEICKPYPQGAQYRKPEKWMEVT